MPYEVDSAAGWTSSIPGSGVGQVFNGSPLDGTNDDDGTDNGGEDVDEEADGDDDSATEVSSLSAGAGSSQVNLAKQDAPGSQLRFSQTSVSTSSDLKLRKGGKKSKGGKKKKAKEGRKARGARRKKVKEGRKAREAKRRVAREEKKARVGKTQHLNLNRLPKNIQRLTSRNQRQM